MRRSNLAAAAATALLALAPARPALAYCRTSSCAQAGSSVAQTGATCSPSQPTDCGVPLAWPNPCVGFSIQKDASKQVSFGTAEAIFKKAFATWMSAPCPGGGAPRIEVTEVEPVECTRHEYNQKACNANAIIFRDDGWPYEGSTNTLALTTVTYNLDNGQIYDADMELNSADAHFTTSDTTVEVDLLSVVTHETGHFLGLSHSADGTATMFPAYTPGQITLRDLADDDIKGICAIYPPGDAIPPSCDITPRHGFATTCADAQTGSCAAGQGSSSSTSTGGCCAVAPGDPSSEGGAASAVIALGAVLLGVRRRRRPS